MILSNQAWYAISLDVWWKLKWVGSGKYTFVVLVRELFDFPFVSIWKWNFATKRMLPQQVITSILFCSVCRLGGLSTHRRVSLQSAKDLPSSSNLNRFSWWMKWEMWIKEHTPALLGTCKEPNLHPQLLKLLLKTKPRDLEWHTAGLSHYLLQTFDIHKWQILLIRRIKIPPYSTSLCEKIKKWKCSITVMTTYCRLFIQKSICFFN